MQALAWALVSEELRSKQWRFDDTPGSGEEPTRVERLVARMTPPQVANARNLARELMKASQQEKGPPSVPATERRPDS